MRSSQYPARFSWPLLNSQRYPEHCSIFGIIRKQSLLTAPAVCSLVHILCIPQLRGKAVLRIQPLTGPELTPAPMLAGYRCFDNSSRKMPVQLPPALHPTPQDGHVAPDSTDPCLLCLSSFSSGMFSSKQLTWMWMKALLPSGPAPLPVAQQVRAFSGHWLHGSLNVQTDLLIRWKKPR